MAFLVLTTSRAGSADAARVGAAVAELARAGPTEVADAEDPTALERIDGRVLVVAGGDGSVHAVVGRLRDRDRLAATTIGIVPLGTGNDLARGLGLPLDPVEAARRVAGGTPTAADLVVADDGEVVVTAAHAGVGAEAARRSARLKRFLGPLAYPAGAALAGATTRGWRLRVEVDGAVVADGRLLMAGVGNGPTIGGGAPLHPDARPDDGRLDVVAVGATEPSRRLAFAAALRRGRHLERGDVGYAQGAVVRISGEAVRHNVDGEVGAPVTDRTYRVEPGAWTVIT